MCKQCVLRYEESAPGPHLSFIGTVADRQAWQRDDHCRLYWIALINNGRLLYYHAYEWDGGHVVTTYGKPK